MEGSQRFSNEPSHHLMHLSDGASDKVLCNGLSQIKVGLAITAVGIISGLAFAVLSSPPAIGSFLILKTLHIVYISCLVTGPIVISTRLFLNCYCPPDSIQKNSAAIQEQLPLELQVAQSGLANQALISEEISGENEDVDLHKLEDFVDNQTRLQKAMNPSGSGSPYDKHPESFCGNTSSDQAEIQNLQEESPNLTEKNEQTVVQSPDQQQEAAEDVLRLDQIPEAQLIIATMRLGQTINLLNFTTKFFKDFGSFLEGARQQLERDLSIEVETDTDDNHPISNH